MGVRDLALGTGKEEERDKNDYRGLGSGWNSSGSWNTPRKINPKYNLWGRPLSPYEDEENLITPKKQHINPFAHSVYKEIDIYFCDLKPALQKTLLKAYMVETPDEMGWDELPITSVEIKI